MGIALLALAACGASAPDRPRGAPGPVNPDPKVAIYACDNGEQLEVGYPDPATSVVRRQGRPYILKIARSASGARYVGYGLQWWAKGSSEGRLAPLAPGEEVASAPGTRCVRTALRPE